MTRQGGTELFREGELATPTAREPRRRSYFKRSLATGGKVDPTETPTVCEERLRTGLGLRSGEQPCCGPARRTTTKAGRNVEGLFACFCQCHAAPLLRRLA